MRDSWVQALRYVVHMTQMAQTVARGKNGKIMNLAHYRWKDDFYYWYSTQDRHAVAFGTSSKEGV